MRLASYSHDGRDRLGAAVGEGMLDLGAATGAPWASDMIAFIEAGTQALEAARAAVARAEADPAAAGLVPLAEVTWHAPVRRPSKICCLALNNSANADRIVSGPKHPAIFLKGANALVGHGGDILVKPHFGRVHPEPELAVVIGRTAREVTAAEAMDHVFGYTVHNDITSPTMRIEDTFNYRAIHPAKDGGNGIEYVDSHVSYSGRYKGSDTFSPMGPWLVTRDDIPDPHALDVTCSHRDEVVTADNTANLFHKVPDVVAFISGYMTLMPGDIISMGTALKAAGAGASGRAVQNIDLQKLGGPVSVTIAGIGTLTSGVARR